MAQHLADPKAAWEAMLSLNDGMTRLGCELRVAHSGIQARPGSEQQLHAGAKSWRSTCWVVGMSKMVMANWRKSGR